MNLTLIKNDFKQNPAGNLSLLLFMTLASSLIVIAIVVITQLFTSINGMYEVAQPPHFLQMHKGELNQEAIDAFNRDYEGITYWQTVHMINVYGADLTIRGDDEYSLEDVRLDIGLVKQNIERDLLLDHNRKVIQLKEGEIGIPVILLNSYDIKIGNQLVLDRNGLKKTFTVTHLVHDAQMNSTLASSTRFLLSDVDFDEMFGSVGEIEYIIEAYFTTPSIASDYQTSYQNADLPQEGQAVTYTMIYLLSGFRDILISLLLILVSFLLVAIALLSIKYTMMATLEEEIKSIGVMKAIGMPHKDIMGIYLKKYHVLIGLGVFLGYVLGLIFSNVFTHSISQTFGSEKVSFFSLSLPMVSLGLVFLLTHLYCKALLKKLRKVTVVDALVNNKGFGKKERVKDGLHRMRNLSVDLLLSLREVVYNFKSYSLIFIVLLMTSGIIIIPINLLNTFDSKEFITYMGATLDDVIIEIDGGEELEAKSEQVLTLLNKDGDIKTFQQFRRVRAETLSSDNKFMNIHIDTGIGIGRDLQYLEGGAPKGEKDIALSKLNVDAIGKGLGDNIYLRVNGKDMAFTITGIYQDVTSGGYTAKATHPFDELGSKKYQFTIKLNDPKVAKAKASEWREALGTGFDVEPMEEFINQTLGGVTGQIGLIVYLVAILGVVLSSLIVVLFMKLRLAKDGPQLSILKAIGFHLKDLRTQYIYKMIMVSLLGIILGTLLANLIGESLVSGMLSLMGFGISKITFIINPLISFIIVPVTLLIVVGFITWLSTRQIRNVHIIRLINE